MKSKIKFMLLLFICFFALNLNVKANGYTDNTTSGGGGATATNGCGGKDSCWSTGYYGLRISLYEFENSDNNYQKTPSTKIGNKVDFIGNIRQNVLTSSTQVNRIEFLDGTNPTFSVNNGNRQNASWLSNMYDYPGRIPNEVKAHVLGNCNGKTKANYSSELEYLNAIEACMIPFFQEMGAETKLHEFFTNVRNGTNTKDIFIIYEPLADIWIKQTSYFYFGTGTEIAYLIDTYSLSWVAKLTYSNSNGGNFVAETAYQSAEDIAGFKAINLANTHLNKGQHNNKSQRYGVSVGVARLSEVFEMPNICTIKDGKYYDKNGKEVTEEEYNKSCKHFCELYDGKYYNHIGDEVTKAQYDIDCGDPITPPPCQFDIITNIVKDCKEGTIGYVKDMDDWNCIYSSRESSNSDISTHFYTGIENRYCSIFCREEVTYSYPNSGLVVRAGHHFGVGQTGASNTLLPVNMTGRSECRVNYGTTGGLIGRINYEQFKSDWKTANDAIITAWDNMNIQLAYSNSIDKAKVSATADCAYFCDYNLNKECCYSGYWDPYDYECGTEKNPRTCTGYNWVCTSYVSKYYHGKWNYPQTQYYNGIGYTASKWCSHCGNSYTSEVCASTNSLDTAVTAYNNALKHRNQYLTQLMQCNNFQRTYKDFKPTIQFKYNEGEYEQLNFNYQYSDDLGKEVEIRAQTDYYTGLPEGGNKVEIHKWNTSSYEDATNDIIYTNGVLGSDMVKSGVSITRYTASSGSKHSTTLTPYRDTTINNANYSFGRKTTISGYDCYNYGSTCNSSKINVTYPTNDSVRMWTTKEYDYSLKSGVYNYVRKDTGQSLMVRTDSNQYVVGYSNLPTHYSRKTRSDYHFYLDFSPEIFGAEQKFYKFLKLGTHTGITYGEEKMLSIYEKLWNNTRLNRMINDCCEGGKHLNHDFLDAIHDVDITTEDFLSTPCAQQFGCYIVSGYKVICPKDNGSRSCNSNNYSQLRACIQSQVVDRVGKPLFTDTDYTYECTYTIKNEIVCPPDSSCNYIGISAVYRTIDLNDPFPERNATGNWTDEDRETYITTNRGVTTNEMYRTKDPMYRIVLTPSLAGRIREYNDNNDMLDYKLTCNSAGLECKSKFIRETYASEFSGCGIRGKTTARCNTGEAW